MKKIRIGKDIFIRWAILTNGEPVPLQGRDLRLVIIDPLRRRISIADLETAGHILQFRFLGSEQKSLGVYSFSLWENFGKADMTAVDACNVFELVSTTCQEPTADMESETIDWQSNIQIGIKGASAYEIAVSQGFQGTVEEWLASLKGADGNKGKSAYEVALENGFQGTVEEWLTSLKGSDGKDGGILYPTFEVSDNMDLIVSVEEPLDEERFEINDEGELIFNY